MSFVRLLRRCATLATTDMPTTTTRTFYKRVLPPTGVAFSSPRGQAIFKDALSNDMVRAVGVCSRSPWPGVPDTGEGGGGGKGYPPDDKPKPRSLTRSLAHSRPFSQSSAAQRTFLSVSERWRRAPRRRGISFRSRRCCQPKPRPNDRPPDRPTD